MALQPCLECSKDISTDADACPNCGKRSPHQRALTPVIRSAKPSWVIRIGGTFLLMMALLVFYLVVTKEPRLEVAQARDAVAPVNGAATANNEPSIAPAPRQQEWTRTTIGDALKLVGDVAGGQCEAMPTQTDACRWMATKKFPFLVKLVSATPQITPSAVVKEIAVMMPSGIAPEHEPAAFAVMATVWLVGDLKASDFSMVGQPGVRTLEAEHGGSTRVEVSRLGSAALMVTVTAPSGKP